MFAAFLASVLIAAPPTAGKRVGVIAVGPDAAAAGDLQRALEVRLQSFGVKGAAGMHGVLGAAPSMKTVVLDPAARAKVDALYTEVSNAYYEDRAAIALDRLGAIGKLHEENAAFGPTDRVRLLLWRTAIFLALQDAAQAENEARAALTLAPDLKVDTSEFRPSVREIVDKVRGAGLRQVTVVVNGLPAGATLSIDGRPAQTRMTVPAGRHRLTASAPGRREVVKTFDATADVALPMTLPIAGEPSQLDAALDAIFGTPDTAALAGIAKRANVDVLVLGAMKDGQTRIALVSRDGEVTSSEAGTDAIAWTEQQIPARLAALPAATPAATPVATHAPRRGLAISTRADLVWTSRERKLSGGNDFATTFTGVGPRFGVEAGTAFFAQIDAGYTDFGISSLTVNRGDGTSAKVGGGSTTHARLGAGWRHAFGSGDLEGSPLVAISAGGFYEAHSAEVVRDASGTDLGFLSSQTRTGADLRLSGRFPVPLGSNRLAISAGASAVPFSTWSESPSGASGASPKPGLAAGAHAGIAFESNDWDAGLSWTIESRSAKFSGTAAPPVSPAIEDATLSETIHSIAVGARYRF